VTDAEIDAINIAGVEAALSTGGSWSYLDFARAIERRALERAIRATAQAKTTSHACDAIRALQDAQSGEDKK
jgi:hypothetical protein